MGTLTFSPSLYIGMGGGGGLFNVKFKLFFIVFSAISNTFLKRLRFH